MTIAPLTRADHGRPAAPVRIVHLGLGNFTRAHQAWYTEQAPDHDSWGIAAFSGHSGAGRRSRVVDALAGQDGVYTLITRGPDGDRFAVISSLSAVHAGSEHDAFRRYLADPQVAIMTSTVTESGYQRDGQGHLEMNDAVRADIAALRSDPDAVPLTVPGRVTSGLAARRASGAGPITILPCDNLAENGVAFRTVVTEFAAALDPDLADWAQDPAHVTWATSMVDRITPATTDADVDVVRDGCGYLDAAPVPTEPFAEWVISGAFPAGRPAWEKAGVQIVDDVAPFEQRKLWLLNGAHSLLAYLGPLQGCETVAEAMAEPHCRQAVDDWWATAAPHLSIPAEDYCRALEQRFENPNIRHLLAQIASDGSAKLPQRIVPVLELERSQGRLPRVAALGIAAWTLHLRGRSTPVRDAGARAIQGLADGSDAEAARRVVAFLAPSLADDSELIGLVEAMIGELEHSQTSEDATR